MLKIFPIIAFVVLASACANLEKNQVASAASHSIENASADDVANKNGLVTLQSNYSVTETADRFESIAKNKGLTLFARIDHQKNAAGVNLTLRPTQVILFGNPKAGTPLMQCAQSVAIDLPQKVLISENVQGRVQLTYNDPKYLQARHNIKGCDKVISNIAMLLNDLSTIATSK